MAPGALWLPAGAPAATVAHSHQDFLFGAAPPSAAHAATAAAASSFLGTAGGHPFDDAHAPHVAESGIFSDGLRSARTALMVTGGMCSKLFGLGMMGFLVYQSMKTNVAAQAQQREQEKSQRQPELVRGVARPSCCGQSQLGQHGAA
mmetsp:Transcript_50415/g.140766  ORF Transcript_50415/g.140766 Transcript_50415/m.140766 type:complete len:147 (+) Transcript_50415:2-442(+)